MVSISVQYPADFVLFLEVIIVVWFVFVPCWSLTMFTFVVGITMRIITAPGSRCWIS